VCENINLFNDPEVDLVHLCGYKNGMKTVTTHSAKTHLSRLLKEVQLGETIVILHGKEPVAKLTAMEQTGRARPKVGKITSGPIRCTEDAFAPLSEEELKEWGL
jgi:antitoxin (DNA-binding transcriptional repressor) of toxin-antitoxin stability system